MAALHWVQCLPRVPTPDCAERAHREPEPESSETVQSAAGNPSELLGRITRRLLQAEFAAQIFQFSGSDDSCRGDPHRVQLPIQFDSQKYKNC